MAISHGTARGKAARKTIKRSAHGEWVPAPDRADPIEILERQSESRLPDLVPLRYQRMAASPFTFLRGAAAVMAEDLARTPVSGLTVQLCGDAHLANFGLYASPERILLFDVNDFDETLPGPWEWDLKRLAASIVVAGGGEAGVLSAAGAYRRAMHNFAQMDELAVWYARLSAEDLEAVARGTERRMVEKVATSARKRTSLHALDKLTHVVDGQRRFIEDPPLIERLTSEDRMEPPRKLLGEYQKTLQEDRRHLLSRFRLVDLARKVVGVGSVGTRCYVALLAGRDEDDPLFLQIKEAGPSVLEPYLGPSEYAEHGRRVVVGQRLMQAASDIFLGWITDVDGRHYYWRQLRDMKGTADIDAMAPAEISSYAAPCGWALARAHARTGDRMAIAGYLGSSDGFDRALAAFAEAYGEQTRRDHQALLEALSSGRLPTE